MTGGGGAATDARGGATTVVLRPIANPLPLGFLALAAGTFVVSGLQLGWVPPEEAADVAVVLVAFVAPLQLLASVFGFLGRDVVAGTGMGLLAGTWLATGGIVRSAPPGSTSEALGMFLIIAAAALLVPAAAAAASKVVPAVVIASSAVRFAVTAGHQLTADGAWQDAAGITGLGLCALAVYAASAMALEDAQRRTILPLGRRGAGLSSMDGDRADQVWRIEQEAGVREQL